MTWKQTQRSAAGGGASKIVQACQNGQLAVHELLTGTLSYF
jgi:hypothetical protein